VNECDWHRHVNEAKTAMLRDEAWRLITRIINYRIKRILRRCNSQV